jgi:uncharacterized membrane protein YdjX (TVP38/TMEM64 family)
LILLLFWKFPAREWLLDFIEWIQDLGVYGLLVFVITYMLVTVLLIPGSLLTLGAGFIWGVARGSVIVSIGSTLGATAAFLVGRYLARGWVAKKVEANVRFGAIDRAIGKQGFRLVLLTRLSPVFPFNILNYTYSLTGVGLRDYVLASWIGMIPGTIVFVYIGSLLGSLTALGSDEPDTAGSHLLLNIIGLLTAILVTIFVTRITRKALKELELSDEDHC